MMEFPAGAAKRPQLPPSAAAAAASAASASASAEALATTPTPSPATLPPQPSSSSFAPPPPSGRRPYSRSSSARTAGSRDTSRPPSAIENHLVRHFAKLTVPSKVPFQDDIITEIAIGAKFTFAIKKDGDFRTSYCVLLSLLTKKTVVAQKLNTLQQAQK